MNLIAGYESLKEKQRRERHDYSEFLSLRVHRALSWLNRSEQCEDDDDAKVVFLWIAFNAAYAKEIKPDYRPSEHKLIYRFLEFLCSIDKQHLLEDIVWGEFTKSIRVLLGNKYIFQPFWSYQNGEIDEQEWQDRFARAKSKANLALGNRDTPKVLDIVISRVYTMRNQLVHGGATWNSKVNREQMGDCANFMGYLVPAIIQIMMDNKAASWEQPCYPVVP